jgi:hypothetical protein
LAFVEDSSGNVLFMGFVDPSATTNLINALSTATALLYFAFDFQAFPTENHGQLLGLLQANVATVTLGGTIEQRMIANTLALSQNDAQIAATLLSAYSSIMPASAAPAALKRRSARQVTHDATTVTPLLLIQPSGSQQSGFTIDPLQNSAGFTGTNYFRRECKIYVYKTASGTPDPTTGIVPPLESALLVGTPLLVPATQKLSVFSALTDVFYGTAPWTPITTNTVPLALDPGAKKTIFQIVVIGGGTQTRVPPGAADPSFFTDAIYSEVAGEWTTDAKSLFLKTWMLDIFMGTVLEMIGTPPLLSITLDAAAESLIEISDPNWQAAIEEFLQGNTPGAIVGLFKVLTSSDEVQQEVIAILVTVINSAVGGAGLSFVKTLLKEAVGVLLGVLEGVNIAFVAGDVSAVSHDLNTANIGEIWTATLTAPALTLTPPTVTLQPGQSQLFSVKLPMGTVPPAGSTIVYDWTQSGALSTLTDGGTNTAVGSIETPSATVTLTTTPSEQATTITVTVTAYFVDATGTKTMFETTVQAVVTISGTQSSTLGAAAVIGTFSQVQPESGFPDNTVFELLADGFYSFHTQSTANVYTIDYVDGQSIVLTAAQVAALPVLTDVLDYPTYGPAAPGLVTYAGGPVNLGSGLIGLMFDGAPTPGTGYREYSQDGSVPGDLAAKITSLRAATIQLVAAATAPVLTIS